MPVIFQCPVDCDDDVLAIFTHLRRERLPLDIVSHGLQFTGDPIACILVRCSVDSAISELCHRDHVVVGDTTFRPCRRGLGLNFGVLELTRQSGDD